MLPFVRSTRRSAGRRPLAALAVVGAVIAASSAGCAEQPTDDGGAGAGAEPSSAPTRTASRPDALYLKADGVDRPGRQLGTGHVDLAVASVDGGTIQAAKAPNGDPAFSFPSYVDASKYPRAMVTVTNAGTKDAFDPGAGSFTWGAAFRLAPHSEGRSNDNGDNLLQRGLFSESAFFKAELDEGKPACEVRGSDGVAVVRSHETVKRNVWYQMRCERVGNYLTVRVFTFGTSTLFSSEVTLGRIGSIDFKPLVPVSVGGKVAKDGMPIKLATDQFNGEVTDAFISLGSSASIGTAFD